MAEHGSIPCPVCGCRERDILETRFRTRSSSVYRRCSCRTCGERYSTREYLMSEPRPKDQASKRQAQETLFRLGQIERNLALLRKNLALPGS